MYNVEICIICLNEIRNDKAKRELFYCDCYLNFHNSCIKKWVTKSNTCPMCRTVMNYNNEEHTMRIRIFIISGMIVVFLFALFVIVFGVIEQHIKIENPK